jgi:hypothetical protein
MREIAATQVPDRAARQPLRSVLETRMSDGCGMMTAIHAGRLIAPGVATSEQEPR